MIHIAKEKVIVTFLSGNVECFLWNQNNARVQELSEIANETGVTVKVEGVS